MARFEFNQETESDDWVDGASRLLNLTVRCCGLVLLAVGFVVALMVIADAWALYDNPDKIKSFARAVERGSNLDLTLSSAATKGRRQLEADNTDESLEAAFDGDAQAPPGLRFSYFVAWLLAILLLLLIGRLAIAAVRTGGELALYDVKVGKLARALLRERTRASSS